MSTKRKGLFFIAGCTVIGCSLLAHLPAQLAVPERYGRMQFLGIGGTLWRGEVKQILYSGRVLPVQDLNWTVRPTALLRGSLKAEFHEQHTPVNRGEIEFDLLSQELEVDALHWEFPAGSLAPWFRAGVSPKGHLALDLQSLRLAAIAAFPAQLEGRLQWENAVLQMGSQTWQIGSPLMQFSGGGEAIKGIVTNSQPTMPGDGTFQCTVELCEVQLDLRPAGDAPQSLLNGLSLMGLRQTGDRVSGQITVALK